MIFRWFIAFRLLGALILAGLGSMVGLAWDISEMVTPAPGSSVAAIKAAHICPAGRYCIHFGNFQGGG